MPMLSAGALIGDYRLLGYTATGAMSEVYEGVHSASGLRVAVKVLLQELCDDEELVARFRNEGRTLQELRHARIVEVFACGILPGGSPYMVMEWLPVDLHQVLSRDSAALEPLAALGIARQLAEALAELHTRGLVHRDLKPANVLLTREGSDWAVKLADLGLAKAMPETAEADASGAARSRAMERVSTGRGTLLGTWDYMAPEQWVQSKGVDPKADVYALGVLMFQILTGRLPFIAQEQKDLMCFHLFEPPPLEHLETLVPAGTRELIARMLEKNPSRRPTMREILLCITPTP
jgi:serine/threonine protein kinase